MVFPGTNAHKGRLVGAAAVKHPGAKPGAFLRPAADKADAFLFEIIDNLFKKLMNSRLLSRVKQAESSLCAEGQTNKEVAIQARLKVMYSLILATKFRLLGLSGLQRGILISLSTGLTHTICRLNQKVVRGWCFPAQKRTREDW